jgi:hypothetical protein
MNLQFLKNNPAATKASKALAQCISIAQPGFNPKLSLGFGCWNGRDARGPKENKAGQRWSEFKGR